MHGKRPVLQRLVIYIKSILPEPNHLTPNQDLCFSKTRSGSKILYLVEDALVGSLDPAAGIAYLGDRCLGSCKLVGGDHSEATITNIWSLIVIDSLESSGKDGSTFASITIHSRIICVRYRQHTYESSRKDCICAVSQIIT